MLAVPALAAFNAAVDGYPVPFRDLGGGSVDV